MKHILAILLILNTVKLYSSSFGITNSPVELVYQCEKLDNGDLIIVGAFQDSILLDSSQPNTLLVSQGEFDFFIARYDVQNNLTSFRSFGGNQSDLCHGLMIKGNSIFLSGTFIDVIDLNPSGTGNGICVSDSGRMNGFILELDFNLDYVRHKSFGGSANVGSAFLCRNNDDKIALAGGFTLSGDFSLQSSANILTSFGSIDTYFMLFDSNLDQKWVKSFGGPLQDVVSDIKMIDNRILLAGTFKNDVDFDPGVGQSIATCSGITAGYLNVFDTLGNFIDVKVLTNSDYLRIVSLEVDVNDNVYILGNYSSLTDFDPGPVIVNETAPGVGRGFLLKLDSTFAFKWVETYGGLETTQVYDLDLENDKLLMVGYFSSGIVFSTTSLTTNLSSSGMRDAYVAIYDTTGAFVWAGRMGGLSDDEGWCISGDGSGGFVVGGIYLGPGDFDPGPGTDSLQHSGLADIFISRVGTIPNSILEKSDKFKSGCRLYPNPGTDRFVLISDREIEQGALEVYAADGKLIKRLSGLSGKSFEISGSFLPGLYLVRLSSEKFQETATWLVE